MMQNNDTKLADRLNYSQVESVIHNFYIKLMAHPQLGRFFEGLDNFQEHEQRITEFWWMSMGGKLKNPPQIDMIGKHFPLGIQASDLETWLVLFGETLGEELPDAESREWMHKALTIAARLKQVVIEHQAPGLQIGEPQ